MVNLLLEVLFDISAFPVFPFCILNTETSHLHFNHIPVEAFVIQIIMLCLRTWVSYSKDLTRIFRHLKENYLSSKNLDLVEHILLIAGEMLLQNDLILGNLSTEDEIRG